MMIVGTVSNHNKHAHLWVSMAPCHERSPIFYPCQVSQAAQIASTSSGFLPWQNPAPPGMMVVALFFQLWTSKIG